MAVKFKIRKGDEVIVLAGRDKGKSGSVLRLLTGENRAIVQGVNVIKRHTRPSQAQPGGIIEKEAAIHISNLSLVDPKSGKAARIGYRVLEDGRKVRFSKASGEVIDV